jgi:RNA polymerase sporulation-specific sigma factor
MTLEQEVQWVKNVVLSIYRKGKIPPFVSFEDLTQCGYEGLLKAKKNFKEEKGNFEKYASVKIYGAIFDELRKSFPGTRRHREVLFVPEEECHSLASEDNPYKIVEEENLKNHVLQKISLLKENHKYVIYEHYFKEKELKDLTHKLSVTKSRVSNIHRSALKKLRRCL